MNDEDEHAVRTALEELAAESRPSSWSDHAGAVDKRVRDRRRVRGAVATGLVASATVAVALLAMTLSGAARPAIGPQGVQPVGPGAAPVSGQPSGTVTRSVVPTVPGRPVPTADPDGALPASVKPTPVTVVPSGRQLHFGKFFWMTLTPTERCLGYGAPKPSVFGCKAPLDGGQKPGTLSVQSYWFKTVELYSPVYVGAGKVTRMTVQVSGRNLPVTVVTLAGLPGYSTGYALALAPAKGSPTPSGLHVRVVAYGSQGQVLAQLG